MKPAFLIFVVILLAALFVITGCNARTYEVDYCGEKQMYDGAKNSYAPVHPLYSAIPCLQRIHPMLFISTARNSPWILTPQRDISSALPCRITMSDWNV